MPSVDGAPPAPPRSTPKVYMTPQIAKRRDGLRPSLLDFSESISKAAKKNPGGLNKPYRTTSELLLQIKESDGRAKEENEIKALVHSINEAIMKLVGPEEDVISCEFSREGCQWILELNPSLNSADENYFIEVILFANDIKGVVNYVVDTLMVPKVEVDPNPMSSPLRGYREAKQAFELISLKVRKAVVQYEFPDFPEGCKGRTFREVYQLNARVGNSSHRNHSILHVSSSANKQFCFVSIFTAQVRFFRNRVSRDAPCDGEKGSNQMRASKRSSTCRRRSDIRRSGHNVQFESPAHCPVDRLF